MLLNEYPLGVQAKSLRSVFTFGFQSPLLFHLSRTLYPPSATLMWVLGDFIQAFQENFCTLTLNGYDIAFYHASELSILTFLL